MIKNLMKMNTLIHYPFSLSRKIGLFLFMVSLLTFLNSFETFALPENASDSYSGEETVQQQFTVRGVITDASTGEPLIGASVSEKGTSNGTVTNTDGSFLLSVQNDHALLVVSYVGYQTVEIPASENLKVSLTEDTKLINEVVVIGYGTQRKGDVTSAIVSVKAEDFAAGKVQDAAELVKGKVAGLTIANNSGDPNASSGIMLRGVSTLMGSTFPLVLVDGIPGSLTTVAPENIESIDVLKDASAAAIYGTRGANGVVIITTKAGKRGQKAHASYQSYYSISDFLKRLEMMGPSDIRAGLTAFGDDGWDTDWLAAVTQNGFTGNHSLSIDGGTETLTYSANATYRYEQGTIKKTDKEEIRLQLNIAQKLLNDKVTVAFNLMTGMHTNTNSNATNGDQTNIYRQALIHNPTSPIYNEDGTYFEEFTRYLYFNPVSMINERVGEYKSDWTNLIGNFTVEPVKNWKTNLMISRATDNGLSGNFETQQYYASLTSAHKNGASRSYGKGVEDNLELTSRYNWTTKAHRLSALAGYSYNYNVYEGFNAWNQSFPTDAYLYNNLGVGSYLKDGKAGMGSYKNDNKLIGFFGRVSYGYNDRYNVLLNMRREGSSKFGKGHQWGTFYGIQGGWTISNESFMESLRGTVNNLKLRAAYGTTGQIVGASYKSLVTYSAGTSYYLNANGVWSPILTITQNPNPDLGWETTAEFNFGLDFGLFGDRLTGSVELYNRKTTDLLYDYNVPVPPNMYGTTTANVGSLENKGVEVTLAAIPVKTKDFEWNSTVTLWHNSNKLLSLSNDLYETENYINTGGLGEPITQPTHRIEVGKAIGHFWGLKAVGLTEDGHWLIEDPNTGDALEYTTTLNDDYYRQWLGSGYPLLNAGWNNTFRYKNIDLNIQLTGQFGFKILNEARAFYENNSIQYNKLKSAADPVFGIAPLAINQQQSFNSYYLEDGDYVKIGNLTLGYTYTLPVNKYVKSVRAYLSAQNLHCFTSYSGLDPEMNNRWFVAPSLDGRDKYPTIRSFTFGLNVNF
jgi:TonB-linked SusC/RagA family outer membrane protein